MIISDTAGNSLKVRATVHAIDDVSFILTKWRPDGTKITKFFLIYEVTSGHCIGVVKDLEEANSRVGRFAPKIKIILENMNLGLGGLFSDGA